MKIKCICQDCKTEIFVNENMVMIKDSIWYDQLHFNEHDTYCDKCIEKNLNRPIELDDLKSGQTVDGMIPCNMFWIYLNKK